MTLDLLWGKIRVYSGNKCFKETKSDKIICSTAMKAPPTTPCTGDSGSPLVCMHGSMPVLTGVVSTGDDENFKNTWGCGEINSILKYVKASSHLHWIKQNMVGWF